MRHVLLWVLLLVCAAPLDAAIAQELGMASFYAAVPDRSKKLSAAHRTLPFGTRVKVTRTDTGASVVVRINDRGPFIRGRVIDVSRGAAEQLNMVDAGVARVRIEVVPALALESPLRAIEHSAALVPPILE